MALLHLIEEEIQSLEVSDPFQEGEEPYGKEGILDIKIHLNNNRKINIEMQASYEADWSERSIFYLCRVYAEDLMEGEDYQKLEICIHVGILDFTLLTSPGFHHHIQLLDNKTQELYSDKFQIHVIELSKLNAPFPEEDQEIYHWAKMIAAEKLEVMQMEIQNDPNRQLVFDEAKHISLDLTQRYIYLREFLADWDKRRLQICGAAVLSFALTGCGGEQQEVSPAGQQEAALVQEAPSSEEQAGPAAETPTSGVQTEAETGAVSSSEIGSEAAFAIALENAGVPEGDAYSVKVEPDRENDISIWQVEFETDYGDYDFEIAAGSGRIIGADYEVDEEWLDFLGGFPVDEDGARAAVAGKVDGASADEVRVWEESDDGRVRYEGELYYDGIKYEFELDGQTGILFDWNADMRE